MKDNRQAGQNLEAPPEEFVKHVKDALEHLYNFPYLQHHPLVQTDSPPQKSAGEKAGRRLRDELIGAIETLSPGPAIPFRDARVRLYNLLQFHYVEGMTIQETAYELGISERQLYRDLRRGEERVAAVLWARRSGPASSKEPRAAHLSSLQEEMARLTPNPRPTDISSLLQQARKAVERLAQQQSVGFEVEVPPQPVIISADPVLVLQVLINLLSKAVQDTQAGTVRLAMKVVKEGVSFSIRYKPASPFIDATIVNEVIVRLIDQLGWTMAQLDQAEGWREVALDMWTPGPTVLVIDDNQGLVDLLDRYLTDHNCRVLAASSGQEGLQLARRVLPDVIVLDIMMPEMDGWEFLQRLRSYEQTTNTPVIVCSVFNDPKLAYSLGASLFLPKPVKRDNILTALHKLALIDVAPQ